MVVSVALERRIMEYLDKLEAVCNEIDRSTNPYHTAYLDRELNDLLAEASGILVSISSTN